MMLVQKPGTYLDASAKVCSYCGSNTRCMYPSALLVQIQKCKSLAMSADRPHTITDAGF